MSDEHSTEEARPLSEEEKGRISLYLHPCHSCRQGTIDVEPCACQPWWTGIEDVIAERVEEVEWAAVSALIMTGRHTTGTAKAALSRFRPAAQTGDDRG